MVKSIRQKGVRKNGIGIDKFAIEKMELTPCLGDTYMIGSQVRVKMLFPKPLKLFIETI